MVKLTLCLNQNLVFPEELLDSARRSKDSGKSL
jgi:hypothetical protein